jgi:hypothetical protein
MDQIGLGVNVAQTRIGRAVSQAHEKWRMTAALLLSQHVYLALEPGVRRDAARTRQHLTSLDFSRLTPRRQYAHVVARTSLIDELAKDLDARACCPDRPPQAHDLSLVIHTNDDRLFVWHNSATGWFLEPSYGIAISNGNKKSVTVTAGVLFAAR